MSDDFSLVTLPSWTERLSVNTLVSELISSDERSLGEPGEGYPVSASAKVLSGDANLTLPAWRGGVGGCNNPGI